MLIRSVPALLCVMLLASCADEEQVKGETSRTAAPGAPGQPTLADGVRRGETGAIVAGPDGESVVALTFDADMTPGMLEALQAGDVERWHDPGVIEVLEQHGVSATFFLTGMWAETYPDVTEALAASDLFELANHSYAHPGFREPCEGLSVLASDDARRDEVVRGAEAIRRATGVEVVFFRFPGGCHGVQDVELVESLGQLAVQWDVESADAFASDASRVAHAVIENVQPGSVVVLHLGGESNAPVTADALEQIISALTERGFDFVTLSELLLSD